MPDFEGAKYRDTQFLGVTEVARLIALSWVLEPGMRDTTITRYLPEGWKSAVAAIAGILRGMSGMPGVSRKSR